MKNNRLTYCNMVYIIYNICYVDMITNITNITIDNYVTEICDSINKFLTSFTSFTSPASDYSNLSKYVEFIEISYPIIQIVNNDNLYDDQYNDKHDICYIDKIITGNMDIFCKVKKILSKIECDDGIITFPTLCINELGFKMLQSKISLSLVPRFTFSNYFGLNMDCTPDKTTQNNICILNLMNNLAHRSYNIFDDNSSKILLRILALETIGNCSNNIIDNVINKNDIKKAIQNMNETMRKFLCDDYDFECEGYPQIVRIALLIYGRRLASYKKIRSYFANTINNTNLVLTTSCDASLLHWKMTFYVMETVYNSVLQKKYYDVDIWTE